jgi:hypothetical protein
MICKTFGVVVLFLSGLASADIPDSDLYRNIEESEFKKLFNISINKDRTIAKEFLISLNASEIMCPDGRISGVISINKGDLDSIYSVSFFELSHHQIEKQSVYLNSVIGPLKISTSYEISGCSDVKAKDSIIYQVK